MNSAKGLRVAVVGAGALGAATALSLARTGAAVTLIDAAPLGRNASGVAAGMLAPAMESALDPTSAGRFGLLAAARDLWPSFVEALGPTGLERCGAVLRAAPGLIAQTLDSLNGQGAQAELIGEEALHTPEDWRLEPRLTLAAMLDGLKHLGGGIRHGRVLSLVNGSPVLGNEELIEVDATILACGYGGRGLAPELTMLSPIKGQILRFPDVEMNEGPILRGPGGYVVPSRDGPVCGATMEPGADDLDIDPLAVERLTARAVGLAPHLAGARVVARAGVRATTPDGLPLVGASADRGVWLAAGARRDGWLIAPMVAASLVRQIVHGEGPNPAFDPARYRP